MASSKTPEPYVEGMAGDVIQPYLGALVDGQPQTFARDFYMQDRLAAMAGALVDDYRQALMRMGIGGWADTDPSPARPPAHCFVVGLRASPEQPPNELMTSPGTIGWNPAGARYRWDWSQDAWINTWTWIEAGAPKKNDLGDWGNDGRPLSYVEDSWRRGREPNTTPHQPGGGRWRQHRR